MKTARIGLMAVIAMFFAFAAHSASASIAGLLEDFSGLGEHAGLHDPDWIYRGQLQFDTGSITVENQDLEVFSLNRIIPGSGSSRTVLEFSDLTIQSSFFQIEDTAGVTIGHLLSRPNLGGVGASVWQLDRDLFFRRLGCCGPVKSVSPSNRKPSQLVVTILAPSYTYYFEYDNDMTDNIPPVELGPFTYESPVSDFQQFEFTAYAEQDSRIYAKLDYLSILPLDAAPGDFSGDGVLDLDDLEMMTRATRIDRVDSLFDLDGDTQVDANDIAFWVRELGNSYIGDANLDGEFNSSDLVLVFNAGEYEDDIAGIDLVFRRLERRRRFHDIRPGLRLSRRRL
ncbi:MAG: hypothetical protein R3C28_18540 [Pirellulaceae bacterium]